MTSSCVSASKGLEPEATSWCGGRAGVVGLAAPALVSKAGEWTVKLWCATAGVSQVVVSTPKGVPSLTCWC